MSLLELPSAKAEAWRWSDLSALPDLAARKPGGGVPASLPWLDCEGPRLLLVDGKPAEANEPFLFENVSGTADHALARMVTGPGWKLRLGRDHAPAGLVQIIHVSTGAADHGGAEIELEEGAQASLVETFVGEGWVNRFARLRLARGARLMIARRILSESGFVSITDRGEVEEGASLVITSLAAGGADTRLDGEIALTGTAAFAEVAGALLARGRQRHDANLVLRHEAPSGMSRQIWRSVADDQAIASVAARVEVARAAQKTDAEQSLKGLLLARAATINAKPELEIFADDVKCAHGATVGTLAPDALFYLASRGVAPAEARALLTHAFVGDALARIGEETVRTAFEADLDRWMRDA